jgi:large subunit ribosomal protein L25
MESFKITASVRDIKNDPKKLRKVGTLPAVLYGNKVQNTPLSVSASEFDKIFKKAGESTLVELTTEDGKKHHVLIHDVQHHFLTSRPMHVDFLEVSMTEKLKANVALEFVGESDAVKMHGGVLVKLIDEIEVECLPSDLPHNLEIDLTGLKTLDDEIHVKDIKVPAKVTVLTEADELVVKVQAPRDVEAELAEAPVENIEAVMAASAKPEAPAEGEDTEEKK